MWTVPRHFWLPLLLLGAFVLRAGTAVVLQHRLDHEWQRTFLIEGDAEGYWELGRNLDANEDYAAHSPPRRVLRMPGFPVFLALSIRLTEGSFLATRILLAAVGAGACALVYYLGRELFDERTGLLAAGLTAVSPVMIGFSVLILSETLFAAALLGSLIAVARLCNLADLPENRKQATRLSLVAGAMIAAATYVRPTWLLAGPVFAVACLLTADKRERGNRKGKPDETGRDGEAGRPPEGETATAPDLSRSRVAPSSALPACRAREVVRRSLLVFAALALALFPWAARNRLVTGHWVVTTLWVGPSLYDGLNPEATGDSDMQFFERDALMQKGLTEYEVNRHYRRAAWEFAAENPRRVAELAAIKAWRFWKPWPSADQFAGFWPAAAVALVFIPMVILAGLGGWSCRRDVPAWLLTAGPILYFSAVHLVFVSSLRYRLPAEYPLAVLAAAGALVLWRRCQARPLATAHRAKRWRSP